MDDAVFRIDHSKKPEAGGAAGAVPGVAGAGANSGAVSGAVSGAPGNSEAPGSVVADAASSVVTGTDAATGAYGAFNAVSEDAQKFLQADPEEIFEKKSDGRKYILTKKTLAKRPVEFGPTKTLPRKETDEKLVQKMIIAIGAIVAVFIVAMLVIFVPRGGQDADVDTSGDTRPAWGMYAGEVTVRAGGLVTKYRGAYIVNGREETVNAGEYESSTDGEVTFLVVNGGKLTINERVTVRKKAGAEDGAGEEEYGEYEEYGKNAAIVVIGDESSVVVNGAAVESEAAYGMGVVAIGGGKVELTNATVKTSGVAATGVAAMRGGEMTLAGATVETTGERAVAVLANDGDSVIKARNVKMSTTGAHATLIVSRLGTAEFVSSAGEASLGRLALIEGSGIVRMRNSDFRAGGVGPNGAADNAAVLIYQENVVREMEIVAKFTAIDSGLTVVRTDAYEEVPIFLVANAVAEMYLRGVTANFYGGERFLVAEGNPLWGSAGTNGGIVTVKESRLNATNTGTSVDSVSTIDWSVE